MKYLDKQLEKGWVVTVDTEKWKVFATHQNLNYSDENLKEFLKGYGLRLTSNYVCNIEGVKSPEHLVSGWAELLEHRLNEVPMYQK